MSIEAKNPNRFVQVIGISTAAVFFSFSLAHAVGGASTPSSGSSSNQSTKKLKCPKGWTFKATTNKCVKQTAAVEQTLPAVGWGKSDPAFLEAAVLAHSGQYRRAIVAFNALDRAGDPYVLNYLGFSHRKLGDVDAALAYYHKALAIQPAYVRAREYLGEGYLALGKLAKARTQLAMIAQYCGTQCDAYQTLEAKIDAYLKA
ncbi:MAG: tetratricopeptide repeat protein [Alphaproteobacteria bacterium]